MSTKWKTASGCAGGECIEVGFKSAAACDSNGCVEVHICAEEVLIRDSKNADSHVLKFTTSEWDTFISAAKNGEFDR